MRLQRRKVSGKKSGNYFVFVDGQKISLGTQDRRLALDKLAAFKRGEWKPGETLAKATRVVGSDVAHVPTFDVPTDKGQETRHEPRGAIDEAPDAQAADVLSEVLNDSKAEVSAAQASGAEVVEPPAQWWQLLGVASEDEGLDLGAGLIVGATLKATELAAKYVVKRSVGEPSEAVTKLQMTTAKAYLRQKLPSLLEGETLDPGQALLWATGLQAVIMLAGGERLQVIKTQQKTPEEMAAAAAKSGA
jgi:hypothetical protein